MKYSILIFCLLLALVATVGHLWATTDGGRLPCRLCRPVFKNSMALPDLVDKTLPAIVELRPGFANWLGAGVLISEDGWILTAGHLVGIVVAGTFYFTGIEANLAVSVLRGRELLNEYLRTQEVTTERNRVDLSPVR